MIVRTKIGYCSFARMRGRGLALLAFLVVSLGAQNSHALGIGSAVADSYIGERLSALIPIFNVSQPNALDVRLVSSSIDRTTGIGLNVSLDRSNSQLALKVTSEKPVKEPYLMFTLAVTDDGNTQQKEFTLLLNLDPQNTSGAVTSSYLPTSTPRAEPLSGPSDSGNLGPYEWAEAGNIPATFGAVIDGQSLWRVARRINRAMGVSINQMMWALYQSNRQAFLTNSVDSLKAGSYLNIPSADQVRQLSDAEAKQALDGLSTGVFAAKSTASEAAIDAPSATIGEQQQATAGESAVELIGSGSGEGGSQPDSIESGESFRLTGIDEQPGLGPVSQDIDLQKSQEIIASLAATVGNLTQELIQKDKKIDFLENKIIALEKLIDVDSGTIAASQPTAQELTEAVESAVSEPTSSTIDDRWRWLGGIVALFLVLGFLFREKLSALIQDLNLFGGEREVHFEPSLPETGQSGGVADSDQERFAAVKEAMNKNKDQGVAFIDRMQDDGEDAPEQDMPEGIELDESSLDFETRFDRLLEDRDFGFALELLDFARHNEIEEDQYHCERLRLLEAKGDEEGFYDYYYDIEASIPTFDLDIQNRISQLVVKLAQAKT
ncbi:MAG: hypothetical protein KJP04_04985 [Arenicella sp.]|nr:hypothetical protein [Arenicella sp.]